jgi:FkbM family methyltransferase
VGRSHIQGRYNILRYIDNKNTMKLFIYISRFILHIGNTLISISKIIYQPAQEKRVLPWFAVNGDKTLRLQYDLNSLSVVFDIGGYEGQWSSDIAAMYNCKIFIFEPVIEFAKNIKSRFSKNNNIQVLDYGLSGMNAKREIALAYDSSSTHKEGNKIEIQLVDVVAFMEEHGINEVDLMKINIEGDEYDLLDRLISSGKIKAIRNIQVQFHDFVSGAPERMNDIKINLSKTHKPTYQYEFVWENWERSN